MNGNHRRVARRAFGNITIRRRPDGTIRFYRAGYNAPTDGRRVVRDFPTRAKADEWLEREAALDAAHRAGITRWTHPSQRERADRNADVTFHQWAGDWYRSRGRYDRHGNPLAPVTLRVKDLACHPQTGMNPEYSNYDGTPHVDERDHWHFYSDAYRTAGNIGLDCLWNGVVPDLCDANARLQRFFLEHDRTCVYAIDGTPVDETVLHPVGFIATTAEGSLAAMHSQEPDALDNAIRWVRLLWDTPIRTGTRRYYDNFLYAFAFLALAGEYRVW